jgi:GNAT superfamily N-acetyltransferase
VTVSLEFVGPEAAPLVRDLMLASFDEYRHVLVVPSSALDETVDDVSEHLRLGGGVVARLDGRAIGSGRYEWREDHVYIGRLSVLPELRGQGIGAAMMEAIHALALGRGVAEARISVRTLLPKNIVLYERLGYQVTARYKHPRGDEIIVDMAKRL